jgi:hypothetical protein
MQSWILAFALLLGAGAARAAEPTMPPIPAPTEAAVPVAPLDGVWPTAPAASGAPLPVADENGAPMAVPPVPAPELGSAKEPAASAELAVAPAPARPRPAFDPAGTVHVVEAGDTLWDISDLYLGTPWIWPSIWKDNEGIENPHRIMPGDKIWVSAREMRKVSDEEAAALLAGGEAEAEPAPAAMAEDVPAVPMPETPRETFEFTELHTVGVVTDDELEGLARIVGTTEEQVLLAQGDVVFVGLGQDAVAEGDQFTIFRTSEKIYNPQTGRPIGYHSEVLGWLEIVEVYGETARGKVRQSYIDFMPGAWLRPREAPVTRIAILDSPPGVEGQIADLTLDPKYRGGGDVVVLNRGSKHGLRPGSALEVYRPVDDQWKETWYGSKPDVEIPHDVVAQLIVLSVQPKTAMAYVRTATTELWYGDRFRSVGGPSLDHSGGLLTLPMRLARDLAKVPQRISVPDVDLPDVPVPAAMDDWNLPRLPLPALDGYDPR